MLKISLIISLTFFTTLNTFAYDGKRLDTDFLFGKWTCTSETIRPKRITVEITNNVEYFREKNKYESHSTLLVYDYSTPQIYSQLNGIFKGSYELNNKEVTTISKDIQLTLEKDDLGLYTQENLDLLSNELKKPVKSEIFVIDNNRFNTKIPTTDINFEKCHRKSYNKLLHGKNNSLSLAVFP